MGSSTLHSRWPVRAILPAILVGASLAFSIHGVASAAQDSLTPVVNAGEQVLKFDWPDLAVGTGEYEEGPTGVTVFRFAHRALAAVDVRGGAPGTVNTDYLRLGYDVPELDAIVFAGGSWYGLEDVTAVATALKDDGVRSGDFDNIALSVGAIIYDLGARRLNEIYPDKRLAQAAYRAARPGIFPLGAQGAGRFAVTGWYFGCRAMSGQGGAYREIGKVKIAAFTVVNAYGVVTDRDGRVAACYRDQSWPADLRTKDLLAHIGAPKPNPATPGQGKPRNTTVSLVVTNLKLTPDELQRLAVQVHTSMARGIQPFSSIDDGDVLYAVSTGELDNPESSPVMDPVDLDTAASEVMWDAILSSIPEQPLAPMTVPAPAMGPSQLRQFVGDYVFSPKVRIRVALDGDHLTAQAVGERPAYAIGKGAPTVLEPTGFREFMVPGRYPLVLRFEGARRLAINPGHWAQVGALAAQ